MDAHSQPQEVLTRQEQRSQRLKVVMEEAIEQLAEQLAAGHSQNYLSFLAFYSRFWTYSVRNTMLIQRQCPQATRCAGLRLWNQLGYHVKRGESAIWIWAPMLKKELDPESGEPVEMVVGFIPAPVFDASQLVEIEDKPLPQPYPVLTDDVGEAYQLCLAKVRATGVVVEESTTVGWGTAGFSTPGKIVIDARLDSRNRLFTLVHELVHQHWHHQLDDPNLSRQRLEFEAESVSFVVAAIMGLEHPTARDYLLVYQLTADELRQSLAVIQMMVRQVMRILELPFEVMHQPEALVA